MLFHIEHRLEGRWEAFGSGEGGEGEDASAAALADLLALAGGTLPVGIYRALPARSASTRWEHLHLGVDGEITPDEEGFDGGRDHRQAETRRDPPAHAAVAGAKRPTPAGS